MISMKELTGIKLSTPIGNIKHTKIRGEGRPE